MTITGQAARLTTFCETLPSSNPARQRAGAFGSIDEKEQTLNQLLAERDGFDSSVGIILLAAPDVGLDAIAALTTGFTGADIANRVNEARSSRPDCHARDHHPRLRSGNRDSSVVPN